MSEKRRVTGGVLVVVLAAIVVLVVGAVRERYGESAGVAAVGSRQPMGEFALEQMDGGRWLLAEHRGQVVAINLWATWCGPCREEVPALVRAVRDLGPSGFAVVGVSLDGAGEDRAAKVQAFAQRYGVKYPMAFPDELSQMSAEMQGIPTTILVDREGRVAKTYVGEVRESVLRADVRKLLGER